jgi:ornithine--oxo-acid transaminase
VVRQLIDVGVLTKDTHRNSIRFAPPLIVKESEIDWAIDRLAEVLDAVTSASPEPIAKASS